MEAPYHLLDDNCKYFAANVFNYKNKDKIVVGPFEDLPHITSMQSIGILGKKNLIGIL